MHRRKLYKGGMETLTPVGKAIAAVGTASELARRLGIKVQSIQQWKRIPAERLIEVESVTGVPRRELRPDLYEERVA